MIAERFCVVSTCVFLMALLGAASVLSALPAAAELETVTVGGQIRIRGNYWRNTFTRGDTPLLVRNEVRWPAAAVHGRPMGNLLGPDVRGHFDWDSDGADYKLVEQRTRLHVRANFTQDVAAFIEFEAFDAWGEDFRSNYVTGVDGRARSADDVEVYQAHIEARDLFGVPLRLRAGRQEMVLGSGWLVGDNSAVLEPTGLSFDGLRLTYTHDLFTLDAIWAKLAENSPAEQDGDIDLYAIYATYHGIDWVAFDAYWILLRDARQWQDTNDALWAEWLEGLLGFDDYDVTNLNTVGLRVSGLRGGFDFEAEAAYQFGGASSVGVLFAPYTYGDDGADFDAWAAHAEIGYTFDFSCQPRVWLGAAYFKGEDKRDIGFWDWLNPLAPFAQPRASISFNRLFSNTVYSRFIDEMAELSNFWTVRAGLSAHPTQSIETGLDLAYLGVVDTFDQPLHIRFRNRRIIFPGLSFWTQKSDADIGVEADLWLRYCYSDDLSIEVGWSHFFTGDALEEGNFNDLNGLLFNGGTDDDDADYLYFEIVVRF